MIFTRIKMTDCKGLLGKLFGHSFEKYMIKSRAYMPSSKITFEDPEVFENYLNGMSEKYEIRCKRCGCKTDE